MWYNYIFINVYYLIAKMLRDYAVKGNVMFKDLKFDTFSECELIAELEFLKKTLHSRFDQYLKFQLQKRGITLLHNTYTGFDSESEINFAQKFQKICISIQTALS